MRSLAWRGMTTLFRSCGHGAQQCCAPREKAGGVRPYRAVLLGGYVVAGIQLAQALRSSGQAGVPVATEENPRADREIGVSGNRKKNTRPSRFAGQGKPFEAQGKQEWRCHGGVQKIREHGEVYAVMRVVAF